MESPATRRFRSVTLRTGGELSPNTAADLDRFELRSILVYRTLVVRRSGTSSRPPSIYNLVWAGRYYEVWQRPDPAPATIVEHLSLGSRYQAGAEPSCREVQRLADEVDERLQRAS